MSLRQRFTPRPARLMVAGLVLAAAGTFALTAAAATPVDDGPPFGGGPGMGMMMGGGAGMGPGGPGMHGMHGGRAGGARGIERMLDAVNATPEQRTQIRNIMLAAATDLRAQREAGRALRDQMREVWTQPNVDARAAEALRQQMLARHDGASKRWMQAMLDVSRVLTPEQRKAIGERMAQRRAMMERHRAERQQMEGVPPGRR